MTVESIFRVNFGKNELYEVIYKKSIWIIRNSIPFIESLHRWKKTINIRLSKNHEKIPQITFDCELCSTSAEGVLEKISINHIYHKDVFINLIIDKVLIKEKITRYIDEKITIESDMERIYEGLLTNDKKDNSIAITFDFSINTSKTKKK